MQLSGYLVIVAACIGCTIAAELKVTIYYESLCPYSREYLVQQAIPGYKTLPDNVVLDLVPYGNAKTINESGTITFDCQHGEKECKGNRYHGCALSLAEISIAADFISCDLAAESPADDSTLESCANSTGLAWSDLQECIDSGKGDEILIENGERTHSATPSIRGVPTTFFDDAYDAQLNNDAYDSFLLVACTLLNKEPEACKSNATETST